MSTYGHMALRVHFTMTPRHVSGKMLGMRTALILAMVAIGTVRIVWRVLGPAEPRAFAMEWTADE